MDCATAISGLLRSIQDRLLHCRDIKYARVQEPYFYLFVSTKEDANTDHNKHVANDGLKFLVGRDADELLGEALTKQGYQEEHATDTYDIGEEVREPDHRACREYGSKDEGIRRAATRKDRPEGKTEDNILVLGTVSFVASFVRFLPDAGLHDDTRPKVWVQLGQPKEDDDDTRECWPYPLRNTDKGCRHTQEQREDDDRDSKRRDDGERLFE